MRWRQSPREPPEGRHLTADDDGGAEWQNMSEPCNRDIGDSQATVTHFTANAARVVCSVEPDLTGAPAKGLQDI